MAKYGDPGNPAVGRPRGAKNTMSVESQEFAASIVCTRWYKASLIKRLRNNTLAPPMEVLLNHYARGKPKDTVDHNFNVDDLKELREMRNEDLAAEARKIAQELEADNTATELSIVPSNGNGHKVM